MTRRRERGDLNSQMLHTRRGISGTGIWTLGLALITDSVPEERIGIVMVRGSSLAFRQELR
jgi:hypothetical protein